MYEEIFRHVFESFTKNGKYDALILAVAGLKRLGWDEHIESVLCWMPYGVGQGALGIECREDDENVSCSIVRAQLFEHETREF